MATPCTFSSRTTPPDFPTTWGHRDPLSAPAGRPVLGLGLIVSLGLGLGAGVGLGAGACSWRTEQPQFGGAQPPTGYRLVSSSPRAGDSGVGRDALITLTMSGFPDPATSIFPSLTLSSSDGTAVSFDVQVDLVGQAIVLSPRAPLAASTAYTVALTRQLTSLTTEPLVEPATVLFTTGTNSTRPDSGMPPALSLAQDIQPLFDHYCDPQKLASCGSCSATECHDSTLQGMIDLSNGQSAAYIIGMPSHEVPSLLLVKPGDPTNSYLLRKLLGPGAGSQFSSQMPNDGIPWTVEQQRRVSDWIAGGARP